MNVALLCCFVRRERRVCDLMLRNALQWLHGCYMSFVLGDSLGTKPCVFPCKVAPAGDERYLGCAAGAGRIVLRCDWFRTVGVASRCSVRVCVSQL